MIPRALSFMVILGVAFVAMALLLGHPVADLTQQLQSLTGGAR